MLSRRQLLKDTGCLVAASLATPELLRSQTNFGTSPPTMRAADFIRRAEILTPALHTAIKPLQCLVRAVPDPARFLRWRMEPDGTVSSLAERTFHTGDNVLFDFGDHCTGYLSFFLEPMGSSVDAPTRLHLTFGEVPGDVAEPLHPYRGTLSEGWLPEETVTLDLLPQQVRVSRRFAFRYVKVDIIATSPIYSVRFSKVEAHTETSFTSIAAPLADTVSPSLRRIDAVSLATLRDCMLTVFEDGPRRDRRLWIGDLRLQALVNYSTCRNFSLVRRCLYLLAAFPRQDGLVHADVFEKPRPTAGGDICLDYAALYVAVLADYLEASNDLSTARELWPVARRQLAILSQYLDSNGLFVAPEHEWIFIDWQNTLERSAAMHGVLLYCYRRGQQLALALHDNATATAYQQTIARMSVAARTTFYDDQQKVFVSGTSKQVSWASQAWLVLAGVATGDMASEALRHAMSDPSAVRPGAPYLYHYVISALLACGQRQEAVKLITGYWGAMVDAGADTFWEVFDPQNSLLSPYGDVHMNSFCHGWSCTPAYFFRSAGLLNDL